MYGIFIPELLETYNKDGMIMIGIYRIVNKVNGKCYVGQAGCIEERIERHWSLLERSKDVRFLQNAYNKYGKDNFYYEVLEECTIDKLDDKEIYWISYYKSNNRKYGYNLTEGGSGSRGYKWSEESRKKLSESCKGRIVSEETKSKISKSLIGNQRSKGNTSVWKGKHLPEETRKKISESLRNPTDDIRKRMSNAQKNRFNKQGVSEETKKKMSDSRKGKFVGRKHINNGMINKFVAYEELDLYLSNGWKLGRLKK